MTSARPCLLRGGSEKLKDELRVPRSRQRNRLRKTRAAPRHVAMQNLIVQNRGDAEPRVFDQPFLHRVREDGALAPTFLLSLSRDLADAILHHLRGPFRREIAAIR